MTKSVTYKFIKGQGWVPGYWEERVNLFEGTWAEYERDYWGRAAREWGRMPMQNIPRREPPRTPAPRQNYEWRPLREVIRPQQAARPVPAADRYYIDDPNPRLFARWVGELDDE